MLKSFRYYFAGTVLLGGLTFLASGCGDDSGTGQKIDSPPDVNAKPDMSQMPGYDPAKKGMAPPTPTTP